MTHSKLHILPLCALLLLSACETPPEPPKVVTVKAQKLERVVASDRHIFPGQTRAVDRVTLAFRVSGPLVERPVFVGDRVKQGQIIARIDPRDFEVRLANKEAQVDKIEAQLRFAKSDYERVIRIQEKDPGAISERLVDEKREFWMEQQAALKVAEAEKDAAQDELSYTYLESPFDGIVVATYVENHEYVKANQPVIRILNNNQAEMMIDVPEAQLRNITAKSQFNVRLDLYPTVKISGTLKEIGTEPNRATRTYPVTLLLKPSKPIDIFSGMTGDAALRVKYKGLTTPVFKLPVTSLFSQDGEDKIWVIDSETSTLVAKKVEVVKMTQAATYVTGDIQPGEMAVSAGAQFLKPGQKVHIWEATP